MVMGVKALVLSAVTPVMAEPTKPLRIIAAFAMPPKSWGRGRGG